MRASLQLNVIENMDCVRICGAFIVLYLQYPVTGAVKDKLCDTLQLSPALTIFQSGVLPNVSTGYINLVSQSDEEFQCTIIPYHTKLNTIAHVSFVEKSKTHSMSICLDKNETRECVSDKYSMPLFMKSTTTLHYRADKQYTGEVACLKIAVKDATVNISCYDRTNTTSSATQVYPTTGVSLSSTSTMNETIPFSTEPFQKKINYTQAWSDKGGNSNSSGTAAGFVTVPVISTVAGVLGCLLIVAVVILIKYRKSKQATNSGDVETENPLYNTDENKNEKVKNDTAAESSNRTDDMVLTRTDLAENTDYNEIMPLTVMNDTNNAAPQDDPNANDYSIIHEENGQDEIDKSGKTSGCSYTYYSHIEIHEDDIKTVKDESTSAILSGPASVNSYTMSKAQQIESEQDSEYHHINEPVIATPFNEYDRIPRQVSKKDLNRDSTYNHVLSSRNIEVV